jgi:hypothetical protein
MEIGLRVFFSFFLSLRFPVWRLPFSVNQRRACLLESLVAPSGGWEVTPSPTPTVQTRRTKALVRLGVQPDRTAGWLWMRP